MENVTYSVEQVKKIVSLLDQITVSGNTSVISLAMVYQELNNGTVSKVEEAGDE